MNKDPQILNVPIEDIIPNRFQPRLNFDDASLQELSSSIKEHGIIQPLVLRRVNDKYEIIAGERRYKAAKMAGLTTVPAVIVEMDDNKSAEVAIVENVQRKDLSSIEEAKSYKALLDKGYLTQEELAKKMGLSQSAISNKLRLLSLTENVQNAIMEGKISERHARSLLQISDPTEQDNWLQKIIDERLTVRELDKKIKETIKKDEEPVDDVPIIDQTPSIDAIKEKAMDIIGSKGKRNTSVKKDSNPKPAKDEKIPNKFFNFLEDEEANMSAEEDVDITPVGSPDSMIEPVIPGINAPIEEKKEEPSIDVPSNESPAEEIEMLDFLAPEPTSPSAPSNTSAVDLTKVNEIINKLENDLGSNNYKYNISKEDNLNEIKYTIVISKE